MPVGGHSLPLLVAVALLEVFGGSIIAAMPDGEGIERFVIAAIRQSEVTANQYLSTFAGSDEVATSFKLDCCVRHRQHPFPLFGLIGSV